MSALSRRISLFFPRLFWRWETADRPFLRNQLPHRVLPIAFDFQDFGRGTWRLTLFLFLIDRQNGVPCTGPSGCCVIGSRYLSRLPLALRTARASRSPSSTLRAFQH